MGKRKLLPQNGPERLPRPPQHPRCTTRPLVRTLATQVFIPVGCVIVLLSSPALDVRLPATALHEHDSRRPSAPASTSAPPPPVEEWSSRRQMRGGLDFYISRANRGPAPGQPHPAGRHPLDPAPRPPCGRAGAQCAQRRSARVASVSAGCQHSPVKKRSRVLDSILPLKIQHVGIMV